VRNVLITQTIGAVVIFFLFKWPYVFGVVPLQCDFVLVEGKIVAVTNTILISLVVILNIIVYIKTKHYARPDRTVSVSFVNNRQPNNNANSNDEEESHQVAIHLEPITNTADDERANTTTNGGNQQERHEPASQTSPATRNNTSNALYHNTFLQIHGGNRRMEVILITKWVWYKLVEELTSTISILGFIFSWYIYAVSMYTFHNVIAPSLIYYYLKFK